MLLIGHRGCSYPGYNQNTLRAFRKVASEGVAAIEFDVQLSADGQLVIVHNLNLEEVSTGSGKVHHTDAATLKKLYAGDPQRGKDRIPFLTEALDFFAGLSLECRPAIHLELKGENTGEPVGKMLVNYIASGRLRCADILISSFSWQELDKIRGICPELDIALLAGSIRRKPLLEKIGTTVESCFEQIFAYGCEDYMLPRLNSLQENVKLLHRKCTDPWVRQQIILEIEKCLAGAYYSDELLNKACEMKARSVNLWYRTVSREFVEKAHGKGLLVLVYTVNEPDELLQLAELGVDGVFTDNFALAASLLDIKS